VSGSASGIGRAVVQRFAAAGWQWYGIDLAAGDYVTLCGDVADDLTWERARRDVESRFGRLDALVNNAGTNTRGSVDEVEPATWQRILAVNLTSVYLSARHLLPLLRSAGGAIVNNASGAGLVGVRRGAAYAASKGGVVALTRQMAVDLASDGVRVNAVCPGVVDTPLVRKLAAGESNPEQELENMARGQLLGRLGTPDEIAAAIVFLASDEASFITGAVLPVDGGYTAR
jgi:NAD(P)-dependent dehydrogenase (short-subunit alcohol dehydrogenase family)